MRSSVRADNGILRQFKLAALEHFLQKGFGVLTKCLWINILQLGCVQTADDLTRRVKTLIEKNCAKNRFKRIRQNRRTTKPPAFQLPFPQAEKIRQVKVLSDLSQRRLFNQISPQPG